MSEDTEHDLALRRDARDRRLAFERHNELRRLAELDEFKAMVARVQAKGLELARGNPLTPAEPDPEVEAELARLAARRRRLATAGVPEPERGTGAHLAYDRIVTARVAADAAAESHPGSLAAMQAVEAFLVSPQQTLIIRGAPGRGKTVAAWFALAGVDRGVIIGASQVSASYESGWQTLVHRAVNAQLAVLNDVSERLSPWQWGQFADVLESRHDNGRRTIVTTNLSTDALKAALGPRVDDRFGQAILVECGGASLRRLPQLSLAIPPSAAPASVTTTGAPATREATTENRPAVNPSVERTRV